MTKATGSFSVLQAAIWAINGTIYCFSSAYLLSMNLNNTTIGILIGVAIGLCFVGQVVFGRIIDNAPENALSRFIILGAGLMLLMSLLLLLKLPVTAAVAIFLVLCLLQQLLPAFINSAGMSDIQKGFPLDFGIGRGFGSFGYAVFSITTGALITAFGYRIIFVISAVLSSVLILSMLGYVRVMDGYAVKAAAAAKRQSSESRQKQAQKSFLRRYERFAVFLVGITIVMVGHTFMSNFIYQIIRFKGGDTSSTGLASAIAAFSEIPVMFVFLRLLKRARCDTWLHISLTFLILKMLGVYFANSMHWVYIAQIAQMPGFALFAVSSAYYTGAVILHDDVVKGQTYFSAATMLGVFVSLLMGGVIIDKLGIQALLLTGVVIMVLGSLIVFFATTRVEKAPGVQASLR